MTATSIRHVAEGSADEQFLDVHFLVFLRFMPALQTGKNKQAEGRTT